MNEETERRKEEDEIEQKTQDFITQPTFSYVVSYIWKLFSFLPNDWRRKGEYRYVEYKAALKKKNTWRRKKCASLLFIISWNKESW